MNVNRKLRVPRAFGVSAARIALAALLGALVAASAMAANIVGTSRNDGLRGTAKADMLMGRGGNDRLYGLAGNDYLAGGPGRDQLVCGTGKDTAIAEIGEKVAKDCEVVKRASENAPTPASRKAQAGVYCGNTVQGTLLCVQTSSDARSVISNETSLRVDCGLIGRSFEVAIRLPGTLRIKSDLSFEYAYGGPLASLDPEITNLQALSKIRGTFTTDGKAAGQLAVTRLSFDYAGSRVTCPGQDPVDWSTTRQG